MALVNLLYQRPTDNVAPSATITIGSGTEDSTYPRANLVDLNPAKPMQFTTTTGRLVFQYGSAQQVDVMALIHHNLQAGLEVRLQANTTNAWGSPPLNQLVTVPADHEDGYPVNPWLDLVELIPLAVNRTYAWWSLVVVGANDLPIALGELWMGATRRKLARGIAWGSDRGEEWRLIEHETEYGVRTKYHLNVKTRSLKGETIVTDAELADLLAFTRSAKGRAKACLVVPDVTQNDAWLVDHANTRLTYRRMGRNANLVTLEFTELSRGLPLRG